jgi:glycosyltransferase involved in cell wall biosynthesis
MGMGRPLVSTARGGTAEFVRDGENALVFEPDDDAGLARAVRRLADEPALRDRLRDNGRRTAQSYTMARFARETVDQIVAAAR